MWRPLAVNNYKFFIKQEVTNQSIITTISDMINVWIENLKKEEIVQKFRDSNPLAKANETWIEKFVTTTLDSGNVKADTEEATNEMKLTTTAHIGLKYTFNLFKQSQEAVYKEITLPLFLIINEFKHRQDVLYRQLEEKDVELLEYKLEGYKITRRNVITSEFKREVFENDCNKGIEVRLKEALGSMSEVMADINHMYSDFLRVITPSTVDLLKQGRMAEVKREHVTEKPKEEVVAVKRPYPKEENVVIRKLKKSKKPIL